MKTLKIISLSAGIWGLGLLWSSLNQSLTPLTTAFTVIYACLAFRDQIWLTRHKAIKFANVPIGDQAKKPTFLCHRQGLQMAFSQPLLNGK